MFVAIIKCFIRIGNMFIDNKMFNVSDGSNIFYYMPVRWGYFCLFYVSAGLVKVLLISCRLFRYDIDRVLSQV